MTSDHVAVYTKLMLKLNNNGFTHILLLIVAASIITLTGFLVLTRLQTADGASCYSFSTGQPSESIGDFKPGTEERLCSNTTIEYDDLDANISIRLLEFDPGVEVAETGRGDDQFVNNFSSIQESAEHLGDVVSRNVKTSKIEVGGQDGILLEYSRNELSFTVDFYGIGASGFTTDDFLEQYAESSKNELEERFSDLNLTGVDFTSAESIINTYFSSTEHRVLVDLTGLGIVHEDAV